ncbi:MAG: signal recognition particle-docking protein FtsY [Deltaproteobacteria bacterium]|nr:signal recognition particle-docking protein FtsY [Deltaproteobacteria bacterium]
MAIFGLKERLQRTHNALFGGVTDAIKRGVSKEEMLEGLEESLIAADVGVATSLEIVESLRSKGKVSEEVLQLAIKEALYEKIKNSEAPLSVPTDVKPFVVMVLGVNGVGKTTTIGKLAKYFSDRQKSVLLGAGDTFRAAATEQLELWGKRVKCPVIKHGHGGDPGAVAFDAMRSAKAKGTDVVLLDTAGRLHTKVNLMEELKKVVRVMDREVPGAPHEKLLVVDGSTGQNAVSQAKLFNDAVGITGLIVTKLDGTAKGGVIIPLAAELDIPIRFIGVGEGERDLQEFYARDFIDALI